MCRVNACCCGCSLKTGAIVCCVFTGISAFSNLLLGVLIFAAANLLKHDGRSHGQSEDVWERAIALFNGIGGFAMFVAALALLAFIFILIGIVTERAGCVMVWLVIDMIQIVCNTIIAILFWSAGGSYVAHGVGSLIGSGVAIYLWIVVLSYYHELNEGGVGTQQTANKPKGVV